MARITMFRMTVNSTPPLRLTFWPSGESSPNQSRSLAPV